MALTPQRAFREPIVAVLGALGGSAPKPEVLAAVASILRDTLSQEDLANVATRDEANWRNRASWERNAMKADGLLRSDTPGRWTLTKAGWAEYERLQSANPSSRTSQAHDYLLNFKPKSSADYGARIQGRTITKSRAHEDLVTGYGRWATTQGFEVGTPHPRDLVLRRLGREWLIEAKVLYGGNATDAVRAAVGQLYSYRYFLYGSHKPTLVALFSEPIGDAYVDFLGSLGILAVWLADPTVFAGNTSARADGLVPTFATAP